MMMEQSFITFCPTYQQFRAHASFVPELEDFAVSERQFVKLLSQVEMHWGGGGLGTGDLTILFNRAASGSAPALGGRGSVCNMLVGSAGYLTYEGVRSICKVISARTNKARQSFVANTIALAEEAAELEASMEAAAQRPSFAGEENPMLEILRKSFGASSVRNFSRLHTIKSVVSGGRSRRERSPPRRPAAASKLSASMSECEHPYPVAEGSSDDEEVWQEIMPGRRPKIPSHPKVCLQPLLPLPDQSTAKGPSAAAGSPSAAAAEALQGRPPENDTAAEGAQGQALAPEGDAAPCQQPQGEPVQGEITSPPYSPDAAQSPSAHKAASVSFGMGDPPPAHPHKHERLNRPNSGLGREADVLTRGGGAGGISSLWLQGDPPVLVKETLLPPACEFSSVRTVINKIQALMAADDFNAVGPQLVPLRADWEGAVADKFVRDASRRAKLAKQAKAKNKASGAAVEEVPEEEDDSPKEVPAEAAVWLLLVAGRCALASGKLESAKAFMHTAGTYLNELPLNHSYHTTVPMCQGTVAYLSGDFTAAAQHFTTAHARAQSVAGCSCNPLAARNAAASLNNWGAAVAMLGEKSLAVRCFRSALSLLDTRSPPGLATAPPKPPPPDPAPAKSKQRPATAPAGKGKAAPPRAPAWGGGGSLDTPAATIAAANLRRVLQASFASNLTFSTIPSHHHPHSSRFPYPSYGRGSGDQLPAAATVSLQGSLAPSNSSGLRGSMRPASAHPSVSSSTSMAQNLAKATTSPHLLSGFALASNPAPSTHQHNHRQPPYPHTSLMPGAQQPPLDQPAPSRLAPSASHPTSSHAAMGAQGSTAAGGTFRNTQAVEAEGTVHTPSPLKTFISSVISSKPSQGPVESVPKWAVRATEASIEEKVKKKGGSSGSNKPAPKKGGDGKGAPKKKKPAGFQLTYPADYYGQPSYSVANIKGLAAPKKKKGAAK